jgi:predicted permease
VLTFGLGMPPSLKTQSPATIRAYLRQLGDRLESTPGVQSASLTWGAFPMADEDDTQFWLEGQPKPQSQSEMNWTLNYIIDPGYLKAMGIPLVRGRFFTTQDNEHTPGVVVVDDVFAGKFFPNQNPIGKRINLNFNGAQAEIIGVVGHVKQWGLDTDDTESLRAQLYQSLGQMPDGTMPLIPAGVGVVVRTAGEPLAAVGSIRQSLRVMNGEQVVYNFETMDEIISNSLAARRFSMMLLGTFAALALLLASIGIYGVISYLVGQRTHEIGLRMALGAQRVDVLRLVIGQGARMAFLGVALGLAASLALTRLMTSYSLLFGVSATDPLTFAAVALLLTVVALAACYLPARRASKVDPMEALRYE